MSDNILNLARVPLNELHRLKDELTLANRSYMRRQKLLIPQFEAVNKAIRLAETRADALLISDHAIVRWLERIEGIDLEPYRARIRAIVEGKYDPNDDHEIVVSEEDGAVVVIRGRKKKEDSPAMVVTILDTDGPIPSKGQMSVMRDLMGDAE